MFRTRILPVARGRQTMTFLRARVKPPSNENRYRIFLCSLPVYTCTRTCIVSHLPLVRPYADCTHNRVQGERRKFITRAVIVVHHRRTHILYPRTTTTRPVYPVLPPGYYIVRSAGPVSPMGFPDEGLHGTPAERAGASG